MEHMDDGSYLSGNSTDPRVINKYSPLLSWVLGKSPRAKFSDQAAPSVMDKKKLHPTPRYHRYSSRFGCLKTLINLKIQDSVVVDITAQ